MLGRCSHLISSVASRQLRPSAFGHRSSIRINLCRGLSTNDDRTAIIAELHGKEAQKNVVKAVNDVKADEDTKDWKREQLIKDHPRMKEPEHNKRTADKMKEHIERESQGRFMGKGTTVGPESGRSHSRSLHTASLQNDKEQKQNKKVVEDMKKKTAGGPNDPTVTKGGAAMMSRGYTIGYLHDVDKHDESMMFEAGRKRIPVNKDDQVFRDDNGGKDNMSAVRMLKTDKVKAPQDDRVHEPTTRNSGGQVGGDRGDREDSGTREQRRH